MPTEFGADTLIVFTTSPTGLGHIRVADAIAEGLPVGVERTAIGLADINASKIHSLGSRVPIALKITEFIQNHKIPERIVTKLYQLYFSSRTKNLELELERVKEEFPSKTTWIIISTHFALSYPVNAIKDELSEKLGVHIFNALVVTDDSPQRIWAAKGTDIIFVPSIETGNSLRDFMPVGIGTHIEVVSFPVSPRLSTKLSENETELLESQLDPEKNEPLHICVPVSGAAVQLPYLSKIIETLSREKFLFTVVGQISGYTLDFFEKLKNTPHTQLSTGLTARATVSLYSSSFFQGLRPACEITKPSEQSFKAILKPNERGGVILLLTDPIGRQEHDNLNFLTRNRLLANTEDQKIIENFLCDNLTLSEEQISLLHYKASHWRALKLPSNPSRSIAFIKRAKETGILYSMLSYFPENNKSLTSGGVRQIWNSIFDLVKYRHG